MNQSAVGGLATGLNGALGIGIPWGDILVGGLPGVVVSDVIDGLVPPMDVDGTISWTNLFWKG